MKPKRLQTPATLQPADVVRADDPLLPAGRRWSVYVNPFRLEQQSLAAVNRLQGNARQNAAEGPGWQRWLVTTFLGDDAFVHVTQVDLSGTQVDDKVPSLSGLTHLEKLNLDNTQITDDGTAVLRAMPALKDLSLRYTNVSDRPPPTWPLLPP